MLSTLGSLPNQEARYGRPAVGRCFAVAGMLMMSTGADDNDIEARKSTAEASELSLLVRPRHFRSSPYLRVHNCETAGRSHQSVLKVSIRPEQPCLVSFSSV